MSEISNELNFEKKEMSHPEYKMHKLIQQSGGQTQVISGGSTSVFEIPADTVFNLSKSTIVHTSTMDQKANLANFMPADTLSHIQSIQLYTRAGVYLSDIQYCNNYLKIVRKPETSLEEFMTNDLGAHAVNTWGGLRRNNIIASAAGANATFQLRADNSAPDLSYTEPKYYFTRTVNNALVINTHFKLSALKNSIFACDKDLYFAEPLLMRITYENANKARHRATAVTDVTNGEVVPDGNFTLTNLALFLAIEQNQAVINGLKQKVMNGGMSLLVPYIHNYKTNLAAAVSMSVSLRFNRGHGQRLHKVYTSLFNGTETLSGAWLCSNVANDRVQSYYSMLNNSRLQEFNVTTASNEDWLIHEEKVKGSVIQSSNQYKNDWFHLDDWSGLKLIDSQGAFNNVTGLSLDVEQKVDIYLTTDGNAAYNIYNFCVTQRVLTVSPSGVSLD